MIDKDVKTLQISSGTGGGTTARISLPADWLRVMGLDPSKKGQSLRLEFDKKEKSIKIKKV